MGDKIYEHAICDHFPQAFFLSNVMNVSSEVTFPCLGNVRHIYLEAEVRQVMLQVSTGGAFYCIFHNLINLHKRKKPASYGKLELGVTDYSEVTTVKISL